MTTNRWTQTCWLLGSVLVPVGCAGDNFSDCTSGACSGGADGGEAGAEGDAATSGEPGSSSEVDDSASSTSSSSAAGSGGATGSGGSGDSEGLGGDSSGATTDGEAGGGGLGEGGAGATSACEDSCAGTCCDDVCVDLKSEPNHCGACGTVCDLANAEGECVAGSCVVSACQDEHVDCNADASDGCEVELVGTAEAPELRRPMFGAFTGSLHAREATGSLRPKFAWAEVEPVTCSAVTYQLQVEDDCPLTGFAGCDFPSPELDVAGLQTPEFVPELDLPVAERVPVGRRYYWRVRACETQQVCSEWSEVFYVDVGRLREDVTGDGYADVVGTMLAPGGNHELFIIRGGGGFGAPNLAFLIPTSQPLLDQAPLSFVGDVNGDGFNDIGGACREPSSEIATQYLWSGGTTLEQATPTLVGTPADVTDAIAGLWAAGDFDRDGYADMVLGKAPAADDFQYFLKRGDAILSPDNGLPVGPTEGTPFLSDLALHAATSGDFNADGYPDLALDAELQSSVSFVFGASSPDPTLERTIELFSGKATSRNPIMAVLDFNGDEIDDLAVLARKQGVLSVVFGSSDLNTEAVPEIWTVELDVAPSDLAVGDLDQTGFDDLMVSGPMIFEGESDPDHTSEWFVSTDGAEEPIAIADHNADGALDLVVASSWYEGVIVPGQYVDLPDMDVITLAH